MTEPDGDRKPTSRREAKKALHRRRILETAQDVFFRDGFVDANLDEIARGAGVAKGTVYRYFDSKADLYVAVLAHGGDVFAERMRAAAEGAGDPADAIRRIARFYFSHWIRNDEYFAIFWALENQEVIGELTPDAVKEVTSLWSECLRILADAVEDGVAKGAFVPCDAWEVANIFWTVANGLIRTEHVSTRRRLRRSRLDRIFEDAIELLLRGLTVPASRDA